MGTITIILIVIIFTVAGFILGALVFRNNSKQLGQLTDTVIDLVEQVKRLKK